MSLPILRSNLGRGAASPLGCRAGDAGPSPLIVALGLMKLSLRWLLVFPASLLAWAVVLLAGTVSHGYAESALCPPDDLVSGFCDNATVRAKIDLLLSAFAALSAVAVVAASVATAPSRKVAVAWLAVAVGSFIAFLLAGFSTEWLSAVIAGTLAAAAITVWHRRPNPPVNKDAAR